MVALNLRFFRAAALLLCLVMMLTVSGVYAIWVYPEIPLPPISDALGLDMGIFEYAPEEILPGGDANDGTVTPGESHLGLMGLVLNEATNFGLNLGDKSVIHSNLQTRTVLFCNQNASGKNLKHLLNNKDNTYGLYFCVEKVTDTMYYLYSFALSDLPDMGGHLGEISVYKTVMEKTDIWRGTVSYLGHAQVKGLTEMGASPLNDKDTSVYSIDVTTWHHTHTD